MENKSALQEKIKKLTDRVNRCTGPEEEAKNFKIEYNRLDMIMQAFSYFNEINAVILKLW